MSSAVPVIILGTDALLAAAPATPVQLAHACLRGGFANVIPASWGDELIASAVLRGLPEFGGGPAVQCSCPLVAHRLLNVGADLRPVLLGLVPPPVAIARYLRALANPSTLRITYAGSCAGAADASIDIRMSPSALIALLGERDIILEEQPRVFDAVLPYDRRRFHSQPGGVPTADALWGEAALRTIVNLDGENLVADLAQHLLGGKNVLIDAAPALGCVCSGAVAGVPVREARQRVVSLEPPRAPTAIIDATPPLDLNLPLPAAPRSPIDVVAVPSRNGSPSSPVRRPMNPEMPAPTTMASSPPSARATLASAPAPRQPESKSLPRAYVVRRRLTPRSLPAIPDDGGGARRPPADAESH